jgi:lipopolysaccharide export LptBFGC system permease protein LptF
MFENGWRRSVSIAGEDSYHPFETLAYAEMRDGPDYFKKEVRVASQMTYPELRSYIEDLGSSGFDVSGLTVDLYRKLSFPLVTVIMAMIAIPFSFTTGRRGAFYGIGISIVIGITYWGAFEVFDKLGGISQLSPMIAAWFPNLIFGFSGFWMLLKVRT